MLFFHYFLGACLQILGTAAGLWLIEKLIFKNSSIQLKHTIHSFFIFTILESTLLALLSFINLTPPDLLQCWFWSKAALGIWVLFHYKNPIIDFLKDNKLLSLVSLLFLIAICVPTANFDCFSAHFAIPRLFLEQGGYPFRPDYQYLDALPLAGHMWYLPGMAANQEGALNVISLIYFVWIIITLKAYHGQRVALYGLLLLLSMPQWIRVSLDPMMDTPSCFYALYAWTLITKAPKKLWGLFFIASCFLVALKPTLIAFPILAACFSIRPILHHPKKTEVLLFILIAILCGGIWYFKNWFVHGNPLYPHLFAGSIAPNLPQNLSATEPNHLLSLVEYALTILADHRWVLSYGPWPLICLPLLLWGLQHSKVRRLLIYLGMGFFITWFFTSFKNRYYMPYLITALPLMSLWIAKASLWIRHFLKLQVLLTLLLFSPYFLQPFYAILKKWDYASYMAFKYPKYEVYQQVNQSDAGKVLLVGQPAYWLTKPHQLAIISETYLDFTKLNSIDELISHLNQHNIDTVVYDRFDAEGMAVKTDPHYSKKSYQAKVCRDWMNQLLNSQKIQIVSETKGMVVAKNLTLSNPLE